MNGSNPYRQFGYKDRHSGPPTLGGNSRKRSTSILLGTKELVKVTTSNVRFYYLFTCRYCKQEFADRNAEHRFYEHLKKHGVNA